MFINVQWLTPARDTCFWHQSPHICPYHNAGLIDFGFKKGSQAVIGRVARQPVSSWHPISATYLKIGRDFNSGCPMFIWVAANWLNDGAPEQHLAPETTTRMACLIDLTFPTRPRGDLNHHRHRRQAFGPIDMTERGAHMYRPGMFPRPPPWWDLLFQCTLDNSRFLFSAVTRYAWVPLMSS